jgi:hypothetical protein
MQNDLEALKALLARVEADEVYNYGSTFAIVRSLDNDFDKSIFNDLIVKAYTGSLDAAKALHEAVLPKRYWKIGEWDGAWTVNIPFTMTKVIEATSEESPARAWLIAILKALISELEQ